MRCDLVSLPTDTHPLDGLFYEPADRPPRGAVLLLHGNAMNFYTGHSRFLPAALASIGYASLAFNRRAHDILATRDSRAPEGTAFQLTAEDIADDETAARWLAARGYAAPIIIGHSNGGLLGAHYVATHPETPALVLLSAHRGGIVTEETLASWAATGLMCGADHAATSARAEALVAAGQGRALMQLPGWFYVISAESYLDRTTRMPDLVADMARVRCPTLYLRGDAEAADMYPGEKVQAAVGDACTFIVIPNCDHYYKGREEAVTAAVVDWLETTFPA